jgi:hypothetical protein
MEKAFAEHYQKLSCSCEKTFLYYFDRVIISSMDQFTGSRTSTTCGARGRNCMSRRPGTSMATQVTLAATIGFCAFCFGAAYGQRGVVGHSFGEIPGGFSGRISPGISPEIPGGISGGISGGGGTGSAPDRDRQAARAAAISKQTSQITSYLGQTRQQDMSVLPTVQKIRRVTPP